jgi:hypothetical protein
VLPERAAAAATPLPLAGRQPPRRPVTLTDPSSGASILPEGSTSPRTTELHAAAPAFVPGGAR